MNKILLFFFVIIGVKSSFAQDNRDILSVLETQTVAWNRGDIEGYMEFYWRSDSTLVVNEKGATYGWKKNLDGFKKKFPDKVIMGRLTLNILTINFIDNKNVFVLCAWERKRNDGTLSGYKTLWMRDIAGVWKIVNDHTSE